VPLGATVSTAVPYFLFTAGNLDLEDPYAKAVALYSLAAFLELFSEPFFIRAQRRSHFQLRLLTETVATLARSFVTFYFVTYAATSTAVPLAFAFGQLVYSLCVLLMYALPQLRFAAIGVRLALGKQRLQWGTLALVGTFSTQVRGASIIINGRVSRVADKRTTSISGFVETRASGERERSSNLGWKRRLTRRVRLGFIFGFAFRENYSAAVRSK
jgi:hypothetical protein